MQGRVLPSDKILIYLVVLAIVLAGMTQFSWWSAICGSCVLSLMAIGERRGVLTSSSPISGSDEPIATLADLLNSSAAASAAFLLGRATAWLWGI